ncbi:hypothetical protein PHLGIDRAFT_306579 [Phlebiopsis gigantea 11061_1 CR5-6]|uniref:Uncharacterized protein n=1 Tax=Phlebiopsis gigantea (strain 11061_1 CR5-6) TaxID=745531 RepID=A0A0C3S004_PHLG1|nr:hypothetical protein PHLGIDRAFT_306579 [Phlebiopsis gigantea 11061_1 CR5-6]
MALPRNITDNCGMDSGICRNEMQGHRIVMGMWRHGRRQVYPYLSATSFLLPFFQVHVVSGKLEGEPTLPHRRSRLAYSTAR